MSGSEVVAVVAAVLAAICAGVFVAVCFLLARSVRLLSSTVVEFASDAEELLTELEIATRHAGAQVERADRLISAAEGVEERVDDASRLARRTLRNPVVKAMAFGAGVSKASDRLRTGTEISNRRRRRRRRAS